MKLGGIDGLIIAAYMFVIAYIGWRSRRFAGRNLENYFLGGRSMPGWMTGPCPGLRKQLYLTIIIGDFQGSRAIT